MASGTATVLEAGRVLLAELASVKRLRTIEFHHYAAEEVGLFGSQDVALTYAAAAVIYGRLNLLSIVFMLVLVGDLLQISVGDLFLGATMPGLLLGGLYIAYILIFAFVFLQAFLVLLIRTRRIDSRLQSPFGAIVFMQAVGVLLLVVDAIHRWLNQ